MNRAWYSAMLLAWGGACLAAGPAVELQTGSLNPSHRCKQCHKEIHAMWSRSMHSMSATDPVFEASYMQAYLESKGSVRPLCLRCHAPGVLLSKDASAEEISYRDGIPCDYCHSVVSVDLARSQPLEVRLDGVKRGPLGDALSPVHDVAQSKLHQTSEFCAGCHEYTNEHGVAVFSTYTEWKHSPQAAEGKTCQACHMPSTPGETVIPEFGTNRKAINLHDISGGHSRDQVRKAATVRVLSIERTKPTVAAVQVEVSNVGSGHSIPTGLPTRKLVLDVTLRADGRDVGRFERVYQKSLLDQEGRPILEDHRTVWASYSLQKDNRLRPGERRVEKFIADVPARANLTANASLHYVYEPKILVPQQMKIEMASGSR